MSIVDTWDLDKIDTSVYDEPIKMTADMKVRSAICDFVNHFNDYPNRIIMGYVLVKDLYRQCTGSILSLEEIERNIEGYMYEGILIDIDYVDPFNLEVGYMVKWTDDRY